MRCLTAKEMTDLHPGFHVNFNLPLHRTTLALDQELDSRANRVGGRAAPNVRRIRWFCDALNRWHKPNVHRVLWVDHWEADFPSTHELFMAARRGLGETRSLSDAPGHYFDAYPYDEQDQTKIPPEQAKETGILVGLIMLMIAETWDGWLVAGDSYDRIEFWEGNIFFYSTERRRLNDAKSLMAQFDCPMDLK